MYPGRPKKEEVHHKDVIEVYQLETRSAKTGRTYKASMKVRVDQLHTERAKARRT